MRKTCFWLELSLMNCQILLNTVDVCRRWMYIVLASLIPPSPNPFLLSWEDIWNLCLSDCCIFEIKGANANNTETELVFCVTVSHIISLVLFRLNFRCLVNGVWIENGLCSWFSSLHIQFCVLLCTTVWVV